MSEPYLGEVRMVGFNFAPRGWALCDGSLLSIDQHQSLYSILGTTYGGDGRTTFALPDLRGRTPIHPSTGHAQGKKGGEESHTLTTSEMPAHTHGVKASSANATSGDPTGRLLAKASFPIYGDHTNSVALHANAVKATGAGNAINNMQPFLTVNFVIAITGTFPPRN